MTHCIVNWYTSGAFHRYIDIKTIKRIIIWLDHANKFTGEAVGEPVVGVIPR